MAELLNTEEPAMTGKVPVTADELTTAEELVGVEGVAAGTELLVPEELGATVVVLVLALALMLMVDVEEATTGLFVRGSSNTVVVLVLTTATETATASEVVAAIEVV